MIEAVELINLCVQCSAHDQPHDHLDAFRSRFAHIIDVWNPREAVRITGEPVQKGFVLVGVYQPRGVPWSWCDRPPVPRMTTFNSSSNDSTARRIALPRL